MENRLLRNEHDKVIAGVSSGLAAYMQVDVTIIRLLFVLSTIFLVGTGVLVYLVMWIVVPVNNDPAARFTKFNDYFKNQQPPFHTPGSTFNQGPAADQPFSTPVEDINEKKKYDPDWQNPVDFKSLPKNNDTGRTIGGLFLLVIGLYFLMNEFHIIPYWFKLGKLWPLVFVAIGLSFILKSKRKNKWEEWKEGQQTTGTDFQEKPADFQQKPSDLNNEPPAVQQKPEDQF